MRERASRKPEVRNPARFFHERRVLASGVKPVHSVLMLSAGLRFATICT